MIEITVKFSYFTVDLMEKETLAIHLHFIPSSLFSLHKKGGFP